MTHEANMTTRETIPATEGIIEQMRAELAGALPVPPDTNWYDLLGMARTCAYRALHGEERLSNAAGLSEEQINQIAHTVDTITRLAPQVDILTAFKVAREIACLGHSERDDDLAHQFNEALRAPLDTEILWGRVGQRVLYADRPGILSRIGCLAPGLGVSCDIVWEGPATEGWHLPPGVWRSDQTAGISTRLTAAPIRYLVVPTDTTGTN